MQARVLARIIAGPNIPKFSPVSEETLHACGARTYGVWQFLGVLLLGISVAHGQTSILTQRSDSGRDGANTNETLLTTTNVNSTQFGNLGAYNVDGYIVAQPLYVPNVAIANQGTHDVVFVATEHDSLYAFDADSASTGLPLWQTNFLTGTGVTTVPIADQGCGGVTLYNEVGITGTPVIDPTTNTLYVVAKTKEVSGTVTSYVFRLHALDITSGAEKFGGPVKITASMQGKNGQVSLDRKHSLQRPALLLANGTLYIAFGSNGCDQDRGWVLAYDPASLQQIAAFNTAPDVTKGGNVWMSGTGLAADSGFVYLATANGTFDADSGGRDYGDSALKLSLTGGALSVADYFTPYDQANLNSKDLDLGSGGVTILPDPQPGPYPHLMVAAGKGGTIYLLNRDSLGGYNPAGNTQIVQSIPGAILQLFGTAAYWNSNVYLAARNDYVKAFAMQSSGQLTTAPVFKTTKPTVNYGVPVISANGNTNGLLWMVHSSTTNGPMMLSAYDATTLKELYNTTQNSNRDALGTAAHFATPVIANGRVYVGTESQVRIYGLFRTLNGLSGNNQSGTVGTTLSSPISVQAFNPYTGSGVSGVVVTFSDGGAHGTFGNSQVTTDATGTASTTYTLPTTAGSINITATNPGYIYSSFTETATAGTPTSLSTISGNFQTGTAGSTLAAPLVLKVKDTFGNGVPGVAVSFSDNNANGLFSSNPVTTDSTGKATVSYTLPTTVRSISITASSGSLAPLTFSEKSVAGAPASLTVVSGNNQTAPAGTKLPASLVVQVQDQYGNLVPGVTVTYSDGGAGGTLTPTNPVTTSSGQASATYTLPGTPGTYTVSASINSLSKDFTETAQ
ncbi:MAG TPA: Ig-like domain-containing protein [Terriglobales bacterium]|nr:Ig-like domain-containing protein [Terriglobales bacterium]